MARLAVTVTHWPRRAVAALIRVYQVAASPFPSPCRYSPTCSTYALDAVRSHGAVKGTWLGIRRILRCHPFARGGHDPVP